MTQEILDRLKQLQNVLADKYGLERELKEIPRSLTTKTEAVLRLKKQYIEKNTQYDALKLKITELREKIAQAERDREQSEALIVDISTQREYEALLKQIKDASDREQAFRKDIQREEKVYEEMGQFLLRDEAGIAQQEAELKDEQERINHELDSRQTQLVDLNKSEKKLTNDGLLNKEIVFKFERIIMKKEGRGIVPLRGGVCTGCNMILPLQFVNDVRSNESDQPHFCPYCSVILYHEDSEDTYFDFAYDEALSLLHTDDDEPEDEEMDEARLMEAEMQEDYSEDEADDSEESLGEDEEELIDDEEEIEDDADEDIEEGALDETEIEDDAEIDEGEKEVVEDEAE